jgi:hypothetical protein
MEVQRNITSSNPNVNDLALSPQISLTREEDAYQSINFLTRRKFFPAF